MAAGRRPNAGNAPNLVRGKPTRNPRDNRVRDGHAVVPLLRLRIEEAEVGRILMAIKVRNLVGVRWPPIFERRIEHEHLGSRRKEHQMVPGGKARPDDAHEIWPLEADKGALPDDQPGAVANQFELRKLRPDGCNMLGSRQFAPPASEPKFVLARAENVFAPALAARPIPEAPSAIAPEPR